MANLFAEAVLMSFMLGGMVGALVALHLKSARAAKAVPAERPAVAMVRRRSRI